MTPSGPVLRVAVVGCGAIAPQHLEAYRTTGRTRLVGLVDPVVHRARALGERFGCDGVYATVDELLAAGSPDLVSVTSPPAAHAGAAVKILRAGRSVLLEKPPCTSLADLDAVTAAERGSGGSAYVVFQHRHGSGARRAEALLARGALGTPQVAVCETLWYRPVSYFDPEWRGTWRGEGGGPTLGHGIHQIDLLLHLLGPWRSLTAVTARVARPVEFEDVSLAAVTFESGAVASVVNSLLSPREVSRIRIDTTAGTLEVQHLYGYRDADWSWTPAPAAEAAAALGRDPGVRNVDGSLAARPPTGTPADAWDASKGDDVPSNHVAQLGRLVDDLLAGRRHATTLASTRRTMEFVTAVYASALQGRPVARAELTPQSPFYADLSGGLPAATIADRMRTT